MRYSLRTLLIIMFLGGPLLAWGWQGAVAWWEWRAQMAAAQNAGAIPAPFQGLTMTNPPPPIGEIDQSGQLPPRSSDEFGALPEDSLPPLELPPCV